MQAPVDFALLYCKAADRETQVLPEAPSQLKHSKAHLLQQRSRMQGGLWFCVLLFERLFSNIVASRNFGVQHCCGCCMPPHYLLCNWLLFLRQPSWEGREGEERGGEGGRGGEGMEGNQVLASQPQLLMAHKAGPHTPCWGSAHWPPQVCPWAASAQTRPPSCA